MNNFLHIQPRVSQSWRQFKTTAPKNSLALDGYVLGPPKFDYKKKIGNLNHHEGVDRPSTSSTSLQVHTNLKVGLLNLWDQPLNLFINDCDHDVCLATWQLENPDRITGYSSEPLFNRLLHITNMMDICAGAWPIKTEMDLVETSIWIYQPYSNARRSGAIFTATAEEMKAIIESVHHRIDKYLLGQGERVKADTAYEILIPGKIPVIREIGMDARAAMLTHGITEFISYRGHHNGGHHYSLIKLTPFTETNLFAWYKKLNKMEGLTGINRWGGGNTCGGSARTGGSQYPPEKLHSLFN
jgi:hypothetical protein